MAYKDLRAAIFLVVGLYLLFRFVSAVTTILFIFFTAILLAMALNPIVTRLARRRIPRPLGAVLVAIVVLLLLAFLGWIIVPSVIAEGQQLVNNAPQYLTSAQTKLQNLFARFPFLKEHFGQPANVTKQALGQLPKLLTRVGTYTFNAASAIVAVFFTLVMTIYTVAYPRPLLEGFLGAIPEPYREKTRVSLLRITKQVRAWVLASLLLGAIIGLLVWIADTILGVPNALLLGVIAFLGEFVPNLGPIAAAIPAVLLALTINPLTALWVLLVYIFIQQVESQFIAPLVLSGSMELHPVSIAFFILVMGSLVGIIGTLLAVPIAAIIKIIYEEFYYKPRNPDREAITRDADTIIRS